ncbi:MAG TPA: prephenate dehydratase domain-containing protein [Chloroflexota bacterium]|nr:prephenate dehydratase domain-containing protein [Chloroflexota bacterium]
MAPSDKLRIATLGGPGTFAAQAAERFVGDGSLTYLPSAQEEWAALAAGEIGAFVMLAESSTTGFGELARRAASPDFPYYVLAEQEVPYGCLLLAKPSSGPITRILGHGSVAQCKPYLDAHYPGINILTERTSSLDAAAKVAAGDGSLALVGTAQTAAQFGLEVLARDIDGGAVGRYWLVGREPAFAAAPERLIVSARVRGGDALSSAVVQLAEAGFAVESMAAWPTGTAMFEYDYLLRLNGEGEIEAVHAAAPNLRLLSATA